MATLMSPPVVGCYECFDVIDGIDRRLDEYIDEIHNLIHSLRTCADKYKELTGNRVQNHSLKEELERTSGEKFDPEVFPRFLILESSTATIENVHADLKKIKTYLTEVRGVELRKDNNSEVLQKLYEFINTCVSIEAQHEALFRLKDLPVEYSDPIIPYNLIDNSEHAKRYTLHYQLACVTCSYLEILENSSRRAYQAFLNAT